jgi:hypothetical protein
MMVLRSGVRQVSGFLPCGFGGFGRAILEAEAVVSGFEDMAAMGETSSSGRRRRFQPRRNESNSGRGRDADFTDRRARIADAVRGHGADEAMKRNVVIPQILRRSVIQITVMIAPLILMVAALLFRRPGQGKGER